MWRRRFYGEEFSPGEELYASGLEDVAVSMEDTSYPASEVLRFDGRPEVVYVYLVVEDLPRGSDLEARIERSGRRSALSWLLAGGMASRSPTQRRSISARRGTGFRAW